MDSDVVRGVLSDPGSPVVGAADADVTVVVFTDYLCSVCKRTDGAVRMLRAEDPRVRVMWKDWPIRGPIADFAARTALAAHRQGAYAVVHAGLMEARGTLSPERIDAIAARAGADGARLAADRKASAREIDAQLAKHNLQAFGLGIAGTPAYVIGDRLIEGGLDARRLKNAVESARRGRG
ncbi:MAG: thioredoxin domain-containing protein [Phenylobacterium sp.]|uniref:DsbA family protein n=1 Tax=Phenylobacterium sp. TaxID=1871053 RepID=UPI001A36E3A9|nr:DsbA family protein [Phenylobacterium sp.]MBL8553550.1 thioredoxin domain-containing protein [Phenylobacterium sp.]